MTSQVWIWPSWSPQAWGHQRLLCPRRAVPRHRMDVCCFHGFSACPPLVRNPFRIQLRKLRWHPVEGWRVQGSGHRRWPPAHRCSSCFSQAQPRPGSRASGVSHSISCHICAEALETSTTWGITGGSRAPCFQRVFCARIFSEIVL